MALMNNPALTVDNQLSSERNKRMAENHLKLKSIAETVILCGKYGIPLRGHQDVGRFDINDQTTKHGKFLGLLQFRVQSGDKILQEHLQKAAGNALYTSKTVQNELITILLETKFLIKFAKHKYFLS